MILAGLTSSSTPQEIKDAVEGEFKQAKGDKGKLALLHVEARERFDSLGYSKDRLKMERVLYDLYSKPSHSKSKSPPTTPDLKEQSEGVSTLLKSGLAISIEDIISKYKEGIYSTDTDTLELTLAAVVAHELKEDRNKPVWIMLVGSPSSGKTEIIDALGQHPKTYALSKFGKKTLASGLRQEGKEEEDPSLLTKLKDNIITFKDFTTMLSSDGNEKKEIFGQLREIFDGAYTHPFGNGAELNWKGHITFIGGVTGTIDHQFKFIQSLGPRFVLVRMKEEDRDIVGRRALETPKMWKHEFHDLVGAFFRSLPYPSSSITLTPEQVDICVDLANFVSTGRYTPLKNYEGDITELPELEMPPRLTQQFATHLQGMAILHRRETIDSEDIRKIVKEGLHTLPPSRRYILEKLMDGEAHTTHSIREGSAYTANMLTGPLDDLVKGGIIEQQNVGSDGGYRLTARSQKWLQSFYPYLTPTP